MSDIIAFLGRVPVFSRLPDDYKTFLSERGAHRSLAQGEYLYPKGGPGDAMFVVVQGQVAEFDEDPALHTAVEVHRFGPAEAFGLTALLGGVPRALAAKALEPSSVFIFDQRIILGFMQRLPQFAVDLCRDLARQVETLNAQKASATGSGPASASDSVTSVPYDEEIYNMIPRRLLEQYRVIPFKLASDMLTIATPDPGNIMAIDDIKRCLHGINVQPVFMADADYRRFMQRHFKEGALSVGGGLMRPGAQMSSGGYRAASSRAMRAKAGEAPTIRYFGDGFEDKGESATSKGDSVATFNEIVTEALEVGASDIHIEPDREGVVVRFRVDGSLQARRQPIPRTMHRSIVARVKVLAQMDISETRMPQDGRISFAYGESLYDMRVSTMPTILGEKAVLRVLDTSKAIQPLDRTVVYDRACKLLRKMVHLPFGAIVACGPTGSGKTTTLYGLIQERREVRTNITTVEDPVEYHVPGVNQIQVNENFGLSFAAVLRGVLRQNPDVILVGETRDAITAKISLEAGLTGHLVLTSLHANTAAGALIRLLEMDMDPFTIGHAVAGIVSQRLLRQVCQSCKTKHTYRPAIADLLVKAGVFPKGFDGALYRGKGCDFCAGTGLRGRVAAFEILTMTEALRETMGKGVTIDVLRTTAKRSGFISLQNYCAHLLSAGLTTPEEVLRIIGSHE